MYKYKLSMTVKIEIYGGLACEIVLLYELVDKWNGTIYLSQSEYINLPPVALFDISNIHNFIVIK